MATVKGQDHFVNDYKISEGNMIGALPAEFSFSSTLTLTLEQKQLKAGADILKGQVVEITDDMVVSPTTAVSNKVLGVAMFDAKNGEPVSVECEGLFKLIAGEEIAAGDHVSSGAAGKVMKVVNGTVATGVAVNVIGIAISTAKKDKPVFVKFSI